MPNLFKYFVLISVMSSTLTLSAEAEDLRSYMHGIEAVQKADGGYLVFFSSSGLPPAGANQDGSWPHDVYVASWSRSDGNLEPKIFISKPEAQEPVSAAHNTDNHTMITFEDGWNSPEALTQRFGVYDDALEPIAPYPQTVSSGGHSGHVAAVGKNFVVFYSEDWITGGGVDNLGSGNGVYTRIYDSRGKLLDDVDVVADKREWWPMLAGSPTHALLLWQKFVPGQTYAVLKMAVLNPATSDLSDVQILEPNVQYYTYRADYIPALDRFLVLGTTFTGEGFAYLFSENGEKIASLRCLPAFEREGGVAVIGQMAYAPAYASVTRAVLVHLELTQNSIALKALQPSPLGWYPIGSVGLPRDKTHLHWVSLSPKGLEEAEFNLNDVKPVYGAAKECETR